MRTRFLDLGFSTYLLSNRQSLSSHRPVSCNLCFKQKRGTLTKFSPIFSGGSPSNRCELTPIDVSAVNFVEQASFGISMNRLRNFLVNPLSIAILLCQLDPPGASLLESLQSDKHTSISKSPASQTDLQHLISTTVTAQGTKDECEAVLDKRRGGGSGKGFG